MPVGRRRPTFDKSIQQAWKWLLTRGQYCAQKKQQNSQGRPLNGRRSRIKIGYSEAGACQRRPGARRATKLPNKKGRVTLPPNPCTSTRAPKPTDRWVPKTHCKPVTTPRKEPSPPKPHFNTLCLARRVLSLEASVSLSVKWTRYRPQRSEPLFCKSPKNRLPQGLLVVLSPGQRLLTSQAFRCHGAVGPRTMSHSPLPFLYTDSFPLIIWRKACCLAANWPVCVSPTRAKDGLI